MRPVLADQVKNIRSVVMKFDQFAYWLQGYFEITEGEASLTTSQVSKIKNHILLHMECSHREKIDPNTFICWLNGAITFYEDLPKEKQEELVKEINQKLNNLFIHKIDPKMPGDKDSLQNIHDGGIDYDFPTDYSGAGHDIRMMC